MSETSALVVVVAIVAVNGSRMAVGACTCNVAISHIMTLVYCSVLFIAMLTVACVGQIHL